MGKSAAQRSVGDPGEAAPENGPVKFGNMRKDGQDFLGSLAEFPPRTFESNFSSVSRRLGLGRLLNGSELNFLFQAAFKAALCKIAFNGLGGCGGQIKPEMERYRTKLETEFMAAKTEFFEGDGWQKLARAERAAVEELFLRVEVMENNYAF